MNREGFMELSGLVWDGRLDLFLKALKGLTESEKKQAILEWGKAIEMVNRRKEVTK